MFAAVLMVTVPTAATGDNIADACSDEIDFSHNGLNNPNASSLNSPSQMAVDPSGHTVRRRYKQQPHAWMERRHQLYRRPTG